MGFKQFWKLADEITSPGLNQRKFEIGSDSSTPPEQENWIVVDYYNLVYSENSAGGHLSVIEQRVKNKLRILRDSGYHICIIKDGYPAFEKLRTKIDRFRQNAERNLNKTDGIIDGDDSYIELINTTFKETFASWRPHSFDEPSRKEWLESTSKILLFQSQEEADIDVRKFIRLKSAQNKESTFTVISGDASLIVGVDCVDRLYMCKPSSINVHDDKLHCDRVCVLDVLRVLERAENTACTASLIPLAPAHLPFILTILERDDYQAPAGISGARCCTHYGLLMKFCLKFWDYQKIEIPDTRILGATYKVYDHKDQLYCASRIIRRFWITNPALCAAPAGPEAIALIFGALLEEVVNIISSPLKFYQPGCTLLYGIPKKGTHPLKYERGTIMDHLRASPEIIKRFVDIFTKRYLGHTDSVPVSGPVYKISRGLLFQYDKLHFSSTGSTVTEAFLGPLYSLAMQVQVLRRKRARACLPPDFDYGDMDSINSNTAFNQFFKWLHDKCAGDVNESPAPAPLEVLVYAMRLRATTDTHRRSAKALQDPSFSHTHLDGCAIALGDIDTAVIRVDRCADGHRGIYQYDGYDGPEGNTNPACTLFKLDQRATVLAAMFRSDAVHGDVPLLRLLGLPPTTIEAIQHVVAMWTVMFPDEDERTACIGSNLEKAAASVFSLAYVFMSLFKDSAAAVEYGTRISETSPKTALACSVLQACIFSPLFVRHALLAIGPTYEACTEYNNRQHNALQKALNIDKTFDYRPYGRITATLDSCLCSLLTLAGDGIEEWPRWFDSMGAMYSLVIHAARPTVATSPKSSQAAAARHWDSKDSPLSFTYSLLGHRMPLELSGMMDLSREGPYFVVLRQLLGLVDREGAVRLQQGVELEDWE